QRTAAGRGETHACGGCQPAVVLEPELVVVPGRLLEVVADDLVQLDEVGSVLAEPEREPLMQVCPQRLRQGVVRGVADQQMPEAERLVARELCTLGSHELLADEPREP